MLALILYIAVGSQLVLSALNKFRDFSAFRSILQSYPLPEIFQRGFFAFLIAGAELLLGFSLLSLNEKIVRPGALATIVFLALAGTLIALRWRRGEKVIRCGCGNLNEERPAARILAGNAALVFLLLFAFTRLPPPPPEVSLFSADAVCLWLAGGGTLVSVKLSAAMLRTLEHLRQWRAAG